ncbi:redox-sensitive transcriptional activator SoxR [Streptomyces sp. TP-A0874]|uniref:redox-sensitive transcriptional activator SoxR n=1 Tax=Streptomyces sp. TP-A0874 TaxID=549819 RepID=UPI00099F5A9E|nr:redox-sensitive transcriptional activator SoxR [Streptomyces sp. TP-A0874]
MTKPPADSTTRRPTAAEEQPPEVVARAVGRASGGPPGPKARVVRQTGRRERLAIGELANRSGLAPSALRYYEELGLIRADRTSGGHRQYARSTLRRLAFIRAAQQVGLTLEETGRALSRLPEDRAPNATQWNAVARTWTRRIDERIEELERLRERLTGCIGCGCLSLRKCALYNPGDVASNSGSGARYLLGDDPEPRSEGGR